MAVVVAAVGRAATLWPDEQHRVIQRTRPSVSDLHSCGKHLNVSYPG